MRASACVCVLRECVRARECAHECVCECVCVSESVCACVLE